MYMYCKHTCGEHSVFEVSLWKAPWTVVILRVMKTICLSTSKFICCSGLKSRIIVKYYKNTTRSGMVYSKEYPSYIIAP